MNALATLLAAVARRLRLAWAVATGQLWLPVFGGIAVALVAVGFLRPWGWPEPAALVLAVVAAVGLVVRGATLRVPRRVAARAADRGLGTKDVFATALEVDGDGLGPWVQDRAERLASGVAAAKAVPLRWSWRSLGTGMACVAVAIGLAAAPNHQDDVRARQARERAAVEEVADDLREQAAGLREHPEATDAQRAEAERLEQLAEELERASSLEQAEEALARAQAEQAAELSAGLESQRAAAVGLERSLGAEALPGVAADSNAADQLEEAADGLDELTADEEAALADRLDALAQGQAVANPDLAAALAETAEALRSGDAAGARAALGEAAAAQRAAAADVAAQDAAADAAARIADAARRLGDAAQGQGQGQAHGQGQGQGDGEGEGQGQGSGSGSGQGQGQGSGAGSPSGNVAGSSASSGTGRGGPGRPDGSGDNPSGGLDLSGDEATVFDPGDELDAGGSNTGTDPGQTVGRGNTGSSRGGSHVPYGRVLADYEARATRALDRADVPPSLRALVRAYFDNLAGRGPR